MGSSPRPGRIVYYVDTTSTGFPILYLTPAGEKLMFKRDSGFADSVEASREFEKIFPRARWMTYAEFSRRLAAIEIERSKIVAWNAWASGGQNNAAK